MTKLLLTAFKIVPIVEQVAIPFVAKLIENGRFVANETHDKSATAMLEELLRWTNALAPLRQPVKGSGGRFLAAEHRVIPHDKMMKSIELFGTKVAPEVRKAVSPLS